MPEGPELHMNSVFINSVCKGLVFSGRPVRSSVSKNPEVGWECPEYTITSESRGKELALTLQSQCKDNSESLRILFRFGMSGKFMFTSDDSLPKHAHLQFRTATKTSTGEAFVLSFVDTRRFGSWHMTGDWGEQRGPDIVKEFDQFRGNVLGNLEDVAFNKPICEAMLNQKYFNGIGNYLRAEILYRAKVPPFSCARTVLEPLHKLAEPSPDLPPNSDHPVPSSASQTESALSTTPGCEVLSCSSQGPPSSMATDILCLCRDVSQEVIQLKKGILGLGKADEVATTSIAKDDHVAFLRWLQCYNNPNMSVMKDKNGRSIWFHGIPGSMAPKGGKVKAVKRRRVPDNPNPIIDKESPGQEPHVRSKKWKPYYLPEVTVDLEKVQCSISPVSEKAVTTPIEKNTKILKRKKLQSTKPCHHLTPRRSARLKKL